PRGVRRPDSPSADDIRFTYATNRTLEAELDAGLAALKARFPEQVDPGSVIYAGFSLGAIMGVTIASRNPARFPRLILVGGGHDKWSFEAVRSFARGGGARVLFVCSQPSCGADAGWAAARFVKTGVATRVVRGPNLGHRYDGPIAEET